MSAMATEPMAAVNGEMRMAGSTPMLKVEVKISSATI